MPKVPSSPRNQGYKTAWERRSSFSQVLLNRCTPWRQRLKISHKISCGYAIALGIAVGGIALGIEIGDYYLWQAWELEDHAQRETVLLHRLQISLLNVQTQQQQIRLLSQQSTQLESEPADLLEQTVSLEQAVSRLLNHTASLKQDWANVEAFVANEQRLNDAIHEEGIPRLLQNFDRELDRYFQQVETLEAIDPAALENQAIQEFSSSVNRAQILQFEAISDELNRLADRSSKNHEQTMAAYDAADILRLEITTISVLLSGSIAVLLALYTSRVIVRPLRAVTVAARRVTQESDFDLQVPVTTTDEVGMLATSLNQLIQRVKQLLAVQKEANEQLESYSRTLEQKVLVRTSALKEANEQLESYSRTLEQKVLARTQALNEQNVRLQQTLEELQQTQTQMIHSEKMSSLGQMVAGVAHEINNPVSFIHGNINHADRYIQDLMRLLQLYQQQYPHPSREIQAEIKAIDLEFLNEDLPKLIHSMQVGADRISDIIRSLRTFSRSDKAKVEAVNLHDGIDSTLMILHHRLKPQPNCSEIEVVKDYGQLPLVEGYAGQLNQVFMNIISNAIDALEDFRLADSQTISTAQNPTIKIHTEVKQDEAIVQISDNGTGISEAVQKRLFDPFFTTKGIGKGTGLGLSISYEIVVKRHGGKMLCLSEPGQGTAFIIQIPIHQQEDAGV